MSVMQRCKKRGHPMIPQNVRKSGGCRSCRAALTWRSNNPGKNVDIQKLSDEYFARYASLEPGETLYQVLGKAVREEWPFMKRFLGPQLAIARLADAYGITQIDVARKVRGLAA